MSFHEHILNNIRERLIKPSKTRLDKYISIYEYNNIKKRDRKKNLISLSLFFIKRDDVSLDENIKIFEKYLNSLRKIIKFIKSLDKWDLRVYLDFNSVYFLIKNGYSPLIELMKESIHTDIYLYKIKILRRGIDVLNEGTIGTIVRYLPLFSNHRKEYNLIYITDADDKPDEIKENCKIGETIKPTSIYQVYYNSKLGYNRKLFIPDNLYYPIVSNTFITSLVFPENLFVTYLTDYYNNKFTDVVKQLIEDMKSKSNVKRTFYKSTNKLNVFPYGMDELFVNYYLYNDMLTKENLFALVKVINDPCSILKAIYSKTPALFTSNDKSLIFNCRYDNITSKKKKDVKDLVIKILPNIENKIISKTLNNFIKYYKPDDDWITYKLLKVYSNYPLTSKLEGNKLMDIKRVKNAKYIKTTNPITVVPYISKNAKNILTVAVDNYLLKSVETSSIKNSNDSVNAYFFDIIKMISLYLSLNYSDIYLRIYIDKTVDKDFIKSIAELDRSVNNIEIYLYKLNGSNYSPKFFSYIMPLYPIFDFAENKGVERVFPREMTILRSIKFNNMIKYSQPYKKIINSLIKDNNKRDIFFKESDDYISMYIPNKEYIESPYYQPYFNSIISSKISKTVFNNFINNTLSGNSTSINYKMANKIVNSNKFKKLNRYGVNNSFRILFAGSSYLLWVHILNKIYKNAKIYNIKSSTEHIVSTLSNIAYGKILSNGDIVKNIILSLNKIYSHIEKSKDISGLMDKFREKYFKYYDEKYYKLFDQFDSKLPVYNYILL